MHPRTGLLLPLLLGLMGGCGVPDDSEPDGEQSSAVTDPAYSKERCDVIVAGGSTAAIAAAISAADAGASTCLVEPTEWIGGQMTASAVSAIDWAWHKVGDLDVGAAGKAQANVTPNLFAMMQSIGNPGACWVSKNCYEPKALLQGPLGALVGRYTANGRLRVLTNTVVKRVGVEGGNITSIVAVQRTPRAGVAWGGYDRLPSSDLVDWYDERPSARYDKRIIELSSGTESPAIVIDATEWGEVLALAGAPYAQGVEATENGRAADERCGQSIVYPFVEKLNASATAEAALPPASAASLAFYSMSVGADETVAAKWDKIFRYRRVRGRGASAQPGDLSLQNWNPGNDYPFGYLFLSREATAAQRADWHGGIDLDVLAGAERHAYGWHTYFKAQGGAKGERVSLDRSVLGTGHGLSKLPYIRDTRRSVGLDGFMLASRDLQGSAARITGKRFADRVAIGAYALDIHGLSNCTYPSYIASAGHETLPFFIPFRALTNRDVPNLLVAGKTMAQTFLANAATRLQPIEWSSGTAAGAAAAHMARWRLSSRAALAAIEDIQTVVKARTPIDWTIGGSRYPQAGEPLTL